MGWSLPGRGTVSISVHPRDQSTRESALTAVVVHCAFVQGLCSPLLWKAAVFLKTQPCDSRGPACGAAVGE